MITEVGNSSKRKWIYNLDENNTINKKMVEVCVKPNNWQNTTGYVVLPFSIHSSIYDGKSGEIKIRSFIKTVKSYSKSKILILLSEGAHLHALSLKHHSYDKALEVSSNDANKLLLRFKDHFNDCEVAFWKDFIWKNTKYTNLKVLLDQEYINNHHLQAVIQSDAARLSEFMDPDLVIDRELFQKKSCLDLLEMITGFMVMNAENYKTVIYPGSMPNAFNYLKKFTSFDGIFINASIKVRDLKAPNA